MLKTYINELSNAMRRLGIHDGDVQTGILLKKYIDKNLFSVLGLKALEQRFKLTDATVQKAFKSLFGQTLATYVLEKRLMVAFDQILVSTDTLTDIGKGCGLTNKNLIANFQQRYGATTRGVRRRGERIFPE